MYLLLLLLLLLALAAAVHAAPITAPDLSRCQKAVATSPVPGSNTTQTLNCCLPYRNIPVVDFTFDRYRTPKRPRVRRPAHLASNATISRLNLAYQRMKNLSPDDPRSFRTQANIHCAFCNGAYFQTGTNFTLQVHFSWLFFPWHRLYLYFHERILASLVGDDPDHPSFALLYWNWDNQFDDLKSNVMPPFFNIKGTPLYDAKRNKKSRQPTERIRLSVASNVTTTDTAEEIIAENLNTMYQSTVTAATSELYMGGPYRQGTDFSNVSVTSAPLAGTLELSPHGGIHFWTGDPARKLRSNMGVFTTAAQDPIFYAHHSNVDRLWEVWRTLPGGNRSIPSDPDFLDTEFLFYDENANLVKVKVRDSLDLAKLGVQYEASPLGDQQWAKNFTPKATTNTSNVALARSLGATEIKPASNSTNNFRSRSRSAITLDNSTFTALVRRTPGSAIPAGKTTEVLVIQGLQFYRAGYVIIRVFINLPTATLATPVSSAEFIGSSVLVPTPGEDIIFTDVVLEIGDSLKILGLLNEELIVVTLVIDSELPSNDLVTIQGMTTQFE